MVWLAGCTCAATEATQISFVTSDPDGIDYGPQFSPDSHYLIFQRSPITGGRAETYEVPIQGGRPKPFLKTAIPIAQTRLRWSSVINKIAFTGIAPNGDISTWLMEGDGTHARQAYPPSGSHAFYPSWYADGSRILELDGDKQSLRVVDLHSGKIRQVTTSPALLVGMGSVSPEGKWIAVAAQRNHGQRYDQTFNQIWLLSDHGQASPLEKNQAEGRAPTWSPDGSKILFESNRGSPEPVAYAVFVADKDGKHVKRLTAFSSNAQHPVWSPDGKWIAFSARQAKARGFGPGIALMPAP